MRGLLKLQNQIFSHSFHSLTTLSFIFTLSFSLLRSRGHIVLHLPKELQELDLVSILVHLLLHFSSMHIAFSDFSPFRVTVHATNFGGKCCVFGWVNAWVFFFLYLVWICMGLGTLFLPFLSPFELKIIFFIHCYCSFRVFVNVGKMPLILLASVDSYFILACMWVVYDLVIPISFIIFIGYELLYLMKPTLCIEVFIHIDPLDVFVSYECGWLYWNGAMICWTLVS